MPIINCPYFTELKDHVSIMKFFLLALNVLNLFYVSLELVFALSRIISNTTRNFEPEFFASYSE